ncbi:MAG: exodeoxyribonuclease VII small subunit [Oscillospiraceae bacterium]|nr:exodeoxyribonuclease VII small subunit [Oscillospiraceae bacterium]
MEEKKTFEQAMERIESIVRALERGDAPLEESLNLFREGAALVADCEKQLDEAEQVVRRLRKTESGEPEELPFDAEDD